MQFTAPPGVFDIIPENTAEAWKSSYLWEYAEKIIRTIANEYGYREIRTPIFEKTELLTRGVGETSDIVTKEMYTFNDKGDRSITLRPEGTAPAMRALIENRVLQQGSQLKVFYIGPMFRYERSQAGRYRQHHQFGVEAVGIEAPELDAEIIDMAYTLYKRLGIKNLNVSINSIGNTESRSRYREALKAYFSKHLKELSPDSQVRFEKNPLRILDSKEVNDIAIVKDAPVILDYLDEDSKKHFEKVQEALTAIAIPFRVNPRLVRGLDYYNKTVFEITTESLGSQNSIGGGGRYDGLIHELGGPDLPAAGFGLGIERILQTCLAQNAALPKKPAATLFLIPLGEEARKVCFTIQKILRSDGVAVQMDYTGRKLNKAMNYANQIGASFTAVIGDEEIKTQIVALKDMQSGDTVKVPLQNIARILKIESSTEDFIAMWKEMDKPFTNKAEAEFFLKRLNHAVHETSKLTHDIQSALEDIKTVLE